MGQIKAYLVLGCKGLTLDQFKFCNGVMNPVADLELISETIYEDVIEFLDRACNLFAEDVVEFNKCVNILTLLYKNYQIFDEKKLHQIQSFFKLHKSCGIWLALILKEDWLEKDYGR